MKKIIKSIIGMEWDFFDNVKSEGGRSACQDDWGTFSKMRRSQYMAWSNPLLESWMDDLVRAKEEGRNPFTEKYGYMMCISDPKNNVEMERRLPFVSDEKKGVARRIADKLIPQNEILKEKYPLVADRGRPLRTADELAAGWTSIETYTLGELWTYSQKTLELFEANLESLEKEGKSYPEAVVENGLKLRGFKDIGDAESYLREKNAFNG